MQHFFHCLLKCTLRQAPGSTQIANRHMLSRRLLCTQAVSPALTTSSVSSSVSESTEARRTNHQEESVRNIAVDALGGVVEKGDERAIEAVCDYLDHRNRVVRAAAVEALIAATEKGDERVLAATMMFVTTNTRGVDHSREGRFAFSRCPAQWSCVVRTLSGLVLLRQYIAHDVRTFWFSVSSRSLSDHTRWSNTHTRTLALASKTRFGPNFLGTDTDTPCRLWICLLAFSGIPCEVCSTARCDPRAFDQHLHIHLFRIVERTGCLVSWKELWMHPICNFQRRSRNATTVNGSKNSLWLIRSDGAFVNSAFSGETYPVYGRQVSRRLWVRESQRGTKGSNFHRMAKPSDDLPVGTMKAMPRSTCTRTNG